MFDAVVLADSPHADSRILGLPLAERGRRVCVRAGARRAIVLRGAEDARALAAWHAEGGQLPLLIVRAGDQLVHVPLVEPLLAGAADRRIAVGPDGAFGGALWAGGESAAEAIAAIASGERDAALAARWTDAERIVHGAIARHPATTPAERRAAARMLSRILTKPEDSPITRYLTRPVTTPLTRLLVRTPITANQVTYGAGLLGFVGCWIMARPGQQSFILGAALLLVASFIDDCDGGMSRLRLTSSKFGAWLDTVVDEATTTLSLLALGYHMHHHHPDLAWVVPATWIGVACCLAGMYGIYYFLVVVSKTGNSQHYVGDLEIAEGDAGALGLRARKKTSSAPPWLQQLGTSALLLARRDFVTLFSLAMALFDEYFALYLIILGGSALTALVVVPEHLRLRRQLRELARRGAAPRLV